MLALFADRQQPQRSDAAALAAESKLDRLHHAPPRADDRYHKIGHDAAALANRSVDLFLEVQLRPPRQIVLDPDPTADPLHGQRDESFATRETALSAAAGRRMRGI